MTTMTSKAAAPIFYVMVDFGLEYDIFKSSELKELDLWPMRAVQKGALVTYRGVKGRVEFVSGIQKYCILNLVSLKIFLV
jgi:hypothetical protein